MVPCRYYHMPLDVSPAWGPVLGFGMDSREMEWVQAPNWWQMMLVSYGGILTVNGTPAPFRPQSLLIVPPAARCKLERVNGDNVSQHWLKFRPNPEGQYIAAIPQVKTVTDAYTFLDLQFRACLDLIAFCRDRLDVMGWNLLWSVSENAATVPENPILGVVEQLVRDNLGAAITAQTLASEAGMSVARLTRLFRDQYGQSPTEYIRTLRMQAACAMLINTSRPIKEIAVRVGFPDLHRFNKVVRDTFGCSPRVLRTERPSAPVHVAGLAEQNQRLSFLAAEPPAYLDLDVVEGEAS